MYLNNQKRHTAFLSFWEKNQLYRDFGQDHPFSLKIEQFYCPRTNFTKSAHRDLTRVNPSLFLTCARLHFQYGAGNCKNQRLNTGMAPTCDWMIKIVKVNKLDLNSLLMGIVNRVSRSGTMKYQCENTNESNKKWLLT